MIREFWDWYEELKYTNPESRYTLVLGTLVICLLAMPVLGGIFMDAIGMVIGQIAGVVILGLIILSKIFR